MLLPANPLSVLSGVRARRAPLAFRFGRPARKLPEVGREGFGAQLPGVGLSCSLSGQNRPVLRGVSQRSVVFAEQFRAGGRSGAGRRGRSRAEGHSAAKECGVRPSSSTHTLFVFRFAVGSRGELQETQNFVQALSKEKMIVFEMRPRAELHGDHPHLCAPRTWHRDQIPVHCSRQNRTVL